MPETTVIEELGAALVKLDIKRELLKQLRDETSELEQRAIALFRRAGLEALEFIPNRVGRLVRPVTTRIEPDELLTAARSAGIRTADATRAIRRAVDIRAARKLLPDPVFARIARQCQGRPSVRIVHRRGAGRAAGT